MVAEELKAEIQCAYSRLLESKGWKPRACQKQMIGAIARTLSAIDPEAETPAPNACVVEAGTGTGKTLAYALAAVPLARARGKKIVIATATIALQEQIVHQDLPDIREHSGLAFSFALAKGRRRYLCLAKLEQASQTAPQEALAFEGLLGEPAKAAPSDKTILKAMAGKLKKGAWAGDRDDWPEELEDRLWHRLSTDAVQCTGKRCSHYDDCYFYKAREDLHKVDCIVTNHDLALADLVMGGGAVLPPPEEAIYIFDEGHHLPEKAMSHFSHALSLYASRAWLLQLPGSLEAAAGELRLTDVSGSASRQIEEVAAMLDGAAQLLMQFHPAADEDGDTARYRFPLGQVPDELAVAAKELAQGFHRLRQTLEGFETNVKDAVEKASGKEREQAERWSSALAATADRLQAAEALWQSFAEGNHRSPSHDKPPPLAERAAAMSASATGAAAHNPPALDKPQALGERATGAALRNSPLRGGVRQSPAIGGGGATPTRATQSPANPSPSPPTPPSARWLTYQQGGAIEGMELALSSCPISVAEPLIEKLWSRSYAVVVTSATLAVAGDFADFQRRTGLAPSNHFLALPSPFRFNEQALLRIPKMSADPKQSAEHTQEIAQLLPELLTDNLGSLALFTSWRQLNRVYEDLDPAFKERVLRQGDLSKLEIVARHKAAVDRGEPSSIFGVASFAEGMDFPGAYCTHVVIAKLPFAVPDEPVSATLAEWIESQGGNPFQQINVPEAAIRMVQMAGRLLRTETDEGQVTVLDRRLLTKGYGKRLLAALPPFRLQTD